MRAGQAEALYVRGRGAGGSSSVNAMGAIRGTVDDYERWADELGCAGWGWPEMLDAFLRVEDDVDYGGDGLHGGAARSRLPRCLSTRSAPLDRAVRARDGPTSGIRRATTTTRPTPPASAGWR